MTAAAVPDEGAHHRQTEVEPLLNEATLLRSHDRRRAQTQAHAARGQALLPRADARDRRRRMTKEGIEAHLRGARVGGIVRVLDPIDHGGETERSPVGRCGARLARRPYAIPRHRAAAFRASGWLRADHPMHTGPTSIQSRPPDRERAPRFARSASCKRRFGPRRTGGQRRAA